MKRRYTISVFTEDQVGLLNRVTIIFTRRKINIESIAASDSEVANVHRYTIVITETEDMLKKVVLQLEKQVEIIKAFYHEDADVVYQELALYKIPTEILVAGKEAEKIVRASDALSKEVDGATLQDFKTLLLLETGMIVDEDRKSVV